MGFPLLASMKRQAELEQEEEQDQPVGDHVSSHLNAYFI